MPEISEKPKGGKPKARSKTALLPQQAGRLLKEKYLRQLDQRPDGVETSGEYATEQVESGGRRAVDGLATAAHRPNRQRVKETPRATAKQSPTAPDAAPSGENPARSRPANAPKERQAMEERSHPAGERGATDPRPANAPKERTAAHIPKERTAEARALKTPRHTPASKPELIQTTIHSHDVGHAHAESTLNNRRRGSSALHTPPIGVDPQSAHTTPAIGREPPPSCKPRRAGTVKERTRTTAATVKTRANVRAATKAPINTPAPKLRPTTSQAAVKQATRKTRQATQQHMTRQMVAQARKAAKTAAVAIKRVAVAVTKAAAALVSSLVGLLGGGFLLIALVVVIIIAAVANSPFGLFFAAEKNAPDTVSVAEAVAQVNMDYNARLEELQAGSYDSIVIYGQAPDWPDVLAVFAVKLAGADTDGLDVATLDNRRVERLKAVYWDMTAISSYVEAIDHPGDGESDSGWTEYILHITITAKTADDMRMVYVFTPYQNSALDELLADCAALSALAVSLTITDADLADILKKLPADLSPERREAVRTALTLVGKVGYFWGGKSSAIGWDSRWGTLQQVTAPGSSTTGTYRPYGLDCTGFVDWVYRNTGLPSDRHWYIGTNLTELSWDDALPGDIALFPDASHVGIVVGKGADGGILVCHCSYSQNNVVVTDCAATGFTVIGRPDVFD